MGNKATIRLISVDAQAVFRAGIKQICTTFPDLEVIGETSGCADALSLCERLRPDLLLIDGGLPDALGLVAQLRQLYPQIGVIMLVDRADEAQLRHAVHLGVTGYLVKQIDIFDLVQAIRSAAGGLLTIDPEAATLALATPGATGMQPEPLSDREQAVLRLLLQGLPNSAIAARLQISLSTVKFHLRNIYGKLGVSSRAEALAAIYGQQQSMHFYGDKVLPKGTRQQLPALAV